MSRCSVAHDAAMRFAEDADRYRGISWLGLRRNLMIALIYEIRAIGFAGDIEPTRAVLHRSAATLAQECRLDALAMDLAQDGLNGSPPPDVASELKDLLRCDSTLSFDSTADTRR